MTFDDDYVQLVTAYGPLWRSSCKSLGLSWPPPDEIQLVDGDKHVAVYVLRRHSDLTDKQRARLTNVCRGAEYVLSAAPEGKS